MKKLAVLSTNNNPDYFFYTPIVEWVWNKYGWEIALFVTSDVNDITTKSETTTKYIIPDIEGVRTNTLAQTVRHFAANVLPQDSYVMVQDIDLIPLADYWHPNLEEKTIWGWDLTGHSFIPVHYTGMLGKYWYELMDCTGDLKADIEREMKANGRAYGANWEQYWDTDWDILTQKVLKRRDEFKFIQRGLVLLAQCTNDGTGNPAHTPIGRVDRYNYRATMNQPIWIDMHCENHNPSAPHKWEVIREVLVKAHGELPEWIDEYVIEHHKKYGQGR